MAIFKHKGFGCPVCVSNLSPCIHLYLAKAVQSHFPCLEAFILLLRALRCGHLWEHHFKSLWFSHKWPSNNHTQILRWSFRAGSSIWRRNRARRITEEFQIHWWRLNKIKSLKVIQELNNVIVSLPKEGATGSCLARHIGKRINVKEILTLLHDLDPSTKVLFLQRCCQMLS